MSCKGPTCKGRETLTFWEGQERDWDGLEDQQIMYAGLPLVKLFRKNYGAHFWGLFGYTDEYGIHKRVEAIYPMAMTMTTPAAAMLSSKAHEGIPLDLSLTLAVFHHGSFFPTGPFAAASGLTTAQSVASQGSSS